MNLKEMLYKLPSYTVVDVHEKKYCIQSSDGFYLTVLDEGDFLRVESIVELGPEYITLTSFSKIAWLCYEHDHAVSWPAPYKNSNVCVRFNEISNFPENEFDLANIIEKTRILIEKIEIYLIGLMESCDLSIVDISMFEDLDTDFIDFLLISEQKEMQFESWDDFKTSALSSDMSDDSKDHLAKVADACQEFERVNLSISLGEVGRHLSKFISKQKSLAKKAKEIH